MESFKICSKIWLENEKGRVFGDGPAKLLAGIHEYGSLRKAAQAMHMSYSQAMDIIKMIEKNLGVKVVDRQIGGEAGGGSILTEDGRALMESYQKFRRELSEEMEKIYQKHFE